MANYRIYKNDEKLTIHNELTIALSALISIGDTITYSGEYKVVDIVHHISSNPIECITDIHVKSINNQNK